MLKKLLLLSTSLLLTACAKPTIQTTVFPVEDISKNLVKDTNLQVDNIAVDGVSVYNIGETPEVKSKISNADLILYLSDEYEGNLKNSLKKSKNAIELEDKLHFHTHEHEGHDHGPILDVALWSSPKQAIHLTEVISEELIKKYPKEKNKISKNTKEYLKELKKIDKKYEDVLSKKKNKVFATTESTFHYLAEDYGLEIIDILHIYEELDNNSPNPENTIKILKDKKVKRIFTDRNSNTLTSENISKAINGEIKNLYTLSYISNSEREFKLTYLIALEENLAILEEGLSADEINT